MARALRLFVSGENNRFQNVNNLSFDPGNGIVI